MKNKTIACFVCFALLVLSFIPALAEDRHDDFRVVDTVEITDGVSRAYVGYGQLLCSYPFDSNPQGYAKTATYSGNAYHLFAQVHLLDDNGNGYSSDPADAYNTTKVVSGILASHTPHCAFIGYHIIWNTSDTQNPERHETHQSY